MGKREGTALLAALSLFAALGAAIPSVAHAGRAGELCAARQIDFFTCLLSSRRTIALCLDKNDFTPSFIFAERGRKPSIFTGPKLRQAVDSSNPHGDYVVTQLTAGTAVITLFVDADYYDLMQSAISISIGKGSSDAQFCLPQTERRAPYNLAFNGKQKSVGLDDLVGDGIAAELNPVPDWPGDGGFTAKKPKTSPAQ